MRNFINSFINATVNIIITLLCLLLIFIVGIIIFSKSTAVEVEDTVSYVQSFISQDNNDIPLTNKDSVNISYDTKNESNKKTTFFYYNQLDETSKIFYDELTKNIDNLKTGTYTLKFNTKFNKLLNQTNGKKTLDSCFQTALDAFFYDHPELFYIDISKMYLHVKYTSIGPKTTYTVSISPEENGSYLHEHFISKDVDIAIKDIEKIKDDLITSVSKFSSEYEKALQIHNTLVKSLEYDTSMSSPNIHNVYGALVDKKVVCEGYAKTFKYIMDSLNIECILVSGIASNSTGHTESHMWNYINLNNKWYGVDVTWDDPVVIGTSTKKNIIRHTYFCKGSNVFNESHKIEKKLSNNGIAFNYPTLSTKNYK